MCVYKVIDFRYDNKKGGITMEKVLDVAKYIINRYEEVAGVTIDELKLHKLLYFACELALLMSRDKKNLQ